MANVLKRDKQRAVLNLLAESSSIRSAERLTGVHRDTICRLVVRFGEGCRQLLDNRMRGLTLRHVECDEIWTFVAKKQARLTVDEKAECHDIGDMYLWTALDQDTKLLASYYVGKRSADNARRFLLDLSGRLILPKPHASDTHRFALGHFKPVVRLSTDAFAGYSEAVDLAFGPYAEYGQIVKKYRNANQPGRYAPPEMVGSDRRVVAGLFRKRDICTSHVERHNLTIRTLMKRFTRLSLGFSKKLENLESAIAAFIAYYDFCWRPRMPGKSGRRRVTPAMAAGVAHVPWTFAELFDAAMP